MLRIAIPLVLALVGLALGAGAGMFLRKTPADHASDACISSGPGTECPEDAAHVEEEKAHTGTEFVKLNNQFVVPVLKGDAVTAMVVVSLSLETATGGREKVYSIEPRLRDGFLRVMFDHAAAGGFDGNFTSGPNLDTLRLALLESGRIELTETLQGVLITDIARQDM